MNNNSNQKKVYQGFLDTFCIRIDQLPQINSYDNYGNWPFLPTDYLQEEMTYITHEGYLNFNVDGVTYLTRDCEDVEAYLESLGYKQSNLEKRTILAAYYDITAVASMYNIDDHVFRLFFALSLVDNFSPIIRFGQIGKKEEEIKAAIERAKKEDPAFNDELWLKSSWRRFYQIEKDRIYYIYALEYIRNCIRQDLNYNNVYIPNILKNPEDMAKIINYWRMSRNQEPNYVISESYIDKIPKIIEEDKAQHKYIGEPKYKIWIELDEEALEDNLWGQPCGSEEELWDALYSLLKSHPKNKK